MSVSPQPAAPERPRFWLRFISLGVRPGMPFAERKAYLLLNSVALFSVVSSTVFVALNLAQGNLPRAWFNLAGAACGGLALLFLGWGRLRAALGVFVATGIPFFVCSALFFGNGSELNLLTLIVLTIFLMESVLWRAVLAALSALGYLAVAASRTGFFGHAAGGGRYLQVTAIAVVTLTVYAAIFRAVSDDYRKLVERKNAELEAERAALRRANEAKERLVSLLAHDLLAPVGHLKEALAHLDAGRLSGEQFATLQERLRDDVDELHGFLDNLLAWSIGQTEAIVPRPVPVPLRALADAAARLLDGVARRKGVSVANAVPEEAVVRADPDQVAAVFRNLLSNAIKFTPAGGRIEIAARVRDASWEVAIRDTGVGVDAARAARLFDGVGAAGSTRGTANEKGLGLGLGICRDFVRANGGTIGAEAAPGGGLLVRFALPRET